MQDVEKVARDGFSVFGHPPLVHAPLERRDQLVAVLFNHEADQLLASPEARPISNSARSLAQRPWHGRGWYGVRAPV